MARPKVKRSLAYCTAISSAVSTAPSDSAASSACARYHARAELLLADVAGAGRRRRRGVTCPSERVAS